ncbi:MAG: thioredoxin family protein [Elusimicrobiales bacterium]|nr:thioredoxin family protein [Elusimicrobiales bacterium]
MKNIDSKTSFEAELAGGDRLALFHSGYCPFCLAFLPAFDKLAKAAPMPALKVSTDTLPELEDLFSVEVVPTVLFFRKGALAARLDGELGRGLSAEQLESFIKACAEGRKTAR